MHTYELFQHLRTQPDLRFFYIIVRDRVQGLLESVETIGQGLLTDLEYSNCNHDIYPGD